jgi:PAS domain S-box-containing protein
MQLRVDRLVRTMYTVRVVAYAWCFIVIGLHVWEQHFNPLLWVAAALHFFVYPHLVYMRALRARDQRIVEMQHVYADAFLLGIWIAVLGFPVWISYPLAFSPALNAIVNRGFVGFAIAVAASCAGVLLGIMGAGYYYWPGTSTLVTALCFTGSIAYSSGVGYILYQTARRIADAREKVRESEHRYRLIAEHAGDLVAMVDGNGRWLYTSPSYARLFRAEDLEIGGDAFSNLHEDDQFRVRGALQVVVRSGESCRLRMRLHTMTGEVRRLEALVHAVREEDGAIRGAVIAARDVTELRDREEQLEVAAHAIDRMVEAIVITNAAGRVLTVNQSFTRITGYPAADVIGHAETEFRSAMQPQAFYDDMYAEVLRSGYWAGTTWSRRRDGTIYREWRSMSAVRDAEGHTTHFITLIRELDGHGADARPAQSA